MMDTPISDSCEGLWTFFDGRITALLNRLPFVRWDRFTEQEEGIVVFGWIDRNDGKHDFITVDIRLPTMGIAYTTSSAEHSKAISDLLFGQEFPHARCQRVEYRWPVENKVELLPVELRGELDG